MKPRVTVLVGSTNEVKVNSVRLAFEPYYDAKVVGVEVESGVSVQPAGEETFQGARRRAANAMKGRVCDFAVGIEGGIIRIDAIRFAFAAVCIVSRQGIESIATTGLFPLPDETLRLVDEGLELGTAMDRLTGLEGVKRGPGAVGILTKGIIDRTKLYYHGTVLALIPHLNRQYTWRNIIP
jgi:inosine/xanthosine triphosphatase